jgi:hypothetical protein
MKKIIGLLLATFILINFSCDKNIYCCIDNQDIYFDHGVLNNFTIQLINVSKFDSEGIPIDYKETTIRTDFINEVSKKIYKIYFFKKNENGHWN